MLSEDFERGDAGRRREVERAQLRVLHGNRQRMVARALHDRWRKADTLASEHEDGVAFESPAPVWAVRARREKPGFSECRKSAFEFRPTLPAVQRNARP